MANKIDPLFEIMMEQGSSDLHMAQGQPPKVRLHGEISPIEGQPAMDEPTIRGYLEEICPPARWEHFLQTGDLDFAYALGEKARFRANYYKHYRGMGGIFRIIPTDILTLEQLKVPEVLKKFADLTSGLVLVTGPTGSGKSTTLAAIVDHINTNQCRHILTIEEPIEFVHPIKNSIIVQREVGIDANSFSDALIAAGRQDLDVVLVGEMRDYETISLAVTAAETGVLVFGTLHTNCASKTIDRIVDAFPAKQQPQIRTMLANSLRGICSQLLLKTTDGKRCACNEILVANTAVATAVREGNVNKINNSIQSGKREGMQLMDDRIEELLAEKKVSGHEAYMKAIDKERFAKYASEG
jgi:twitching motility protein PilT